MLIHWYFDYTTVVKIENKTAFKIAALGFKVYVIMDPLIIIHSEIEWACVQEK